MKFPKVTKRIFKEPECLRDWHISELYDIEQKHDVLITHRETDKRSEDIFITDVFYKLKPKIKWEYAYSWKRVEGATKFLCIGGPLSGTKQINFHNKDYVSYNKNGYPGPKCILVHESLLNK